MRVIACLDREFCLKSIINYYNYNLQIEQKENREIY